MSTYSSQYSSRMVRNGTGSSSFPVRGSAHSSRQRRGRGAPSQSGTQNGVRYKILSDTEMKKVQNKIKMLSKLHSTTQDPGQKPLIKLQYKAALSEELVSNLARAKRKNKGLEKDLSEKKRKLEESEKSVDGKRKEIRRLKDKLRKKEKSLGFQINDYNYLLRKNDSLNETNMQLQKNLEERDSKISSLEDDCEEKVKRGVKRARETLIAETWKQKKQNDSLNETNKQLLKNLEESDSKISSLENDFEEKFERGVKRARETLIAEMGKQKKHADFVHELEIKKRETENIILTKKLKMRESELIEARSTLEAAFKKQKATQDKINKFIQEFQSD